TNSIYSNGRSTSGTTADRLGIDLGGDGVTLNTPGGPHSGANDFQNFPVLTAVTAGASSTTIAGTLNSAVNKNDTIQSSASAASDPTGYGEGQPSLGQITNAKTNSSGNLSFTASVNALPVGQSVVTATATDPGGNTSEFSHGLSNIAPVARDDDY